MLKFRHPVVLQQLPVAVAGRWFYFDGVEVVLRHGSKCARFEFDVFIVVEILDTEVGRDRRKLKEIEPVEVDRGIDVSVIPFDFVLISPRLYNLFLRIFFSVLYTCLSQALF